MVPEVDLWVWLDGELGLICILEIRGVVYIAATYAYVRDANEDVVWIGELWYWSVFQTSVFRTVEDYRGVLHFFDVRRCTLQGRLVVGGLGEREGNRRIISFPRVIIVRLPTQPIILHRPTCTLMVATRKDDG